MAESKYFPNLKNGKDNADVEQIENAFSDIENDVQALQTKTEEISSLVNTKLDYEIGYEDLIDTYKCDGDEVKIYKMVGNSDTYPNVRLLNPYFLISFADFGPGESYQMCFYPNGIVKRRQCFNGVWSDWESAVYSDEFEYMLSNKQNNLNFDFTPSKGSENPVTSDGIYNELLNYSKTTELDLLKQKSVPHTTASGSKIKLTDCLENEPLISCRVYGTADGVGDLVSSGDYEGKYKVTVVVSGANIWNNETLDSIRDFNTKTETGFVLSGDAYSNAIKLCSTFKNEARLKVGDIIRFSFIVDVPENPSGSIGSVYFGSLRPIALNLSASGEGTYQVITDCKITTLDFEFAVAFYGDNSYTGKKTVYKNVQIFKVDEAVSGTKLLQGESIDWNYEPYATPVVKEIYLDAPLGEGEYIEVEGLSTVASSVNTINVETANAPERIEAEYYRDVNKVLANLENAVLSLGGNV